MGYITNSLSKIIPSTAVQNTTAPTFGGISSVTPNNDGSFSLAYSAASGSVALPIEYNLYVAAGSVSAASLFVSSNLVATVYTLAPKLFTLADYSTYFVNGSTYTFGVRAESSEGVVETNNTIITSIAVASGNIGGVFQTTATNLSATESALNSDLVTLGSELTTLSGEISTLSTEVTDITDAATSIHTSASLVASTIL